MKGSTLLYLGGAVVALVLLSARKPAPPPPTQAQAVIQRIGPVVDSLTQLYASIFGGQTGQTVGETAPVAFSSRTPAASMLGTASGFPPAPDVSAYWDAPIIQAA